jgi:hypothetical protein
MTWGKFVGQLRHHSGVDALERGHTGGPVAASSSHLRAVAALSGPRGAVAGAAGQPEAALPWS